MSKGLLICSLIILLSFTFTIENDRKCDQEIIENLINGKKHHKVGESIGRYFYNHGEDASILKLQKQWYKQLKRDLMDSSIFENKKVGFKKAPSSRNCYPGELTSYEYVSFIGSLNFVRAIAGVPFVNDIDSASSINCQKAAWCLTVNNKITHFIPKTFKCFSTGAASAASQSNLAYGYPRGQAIFGLLRDEEHENSSVGHRRWLLNPSLTFPGYGLTDKVVVVQVFGDRTNFRNAYKDLEEYDRRGIAWPVIGLHPLFLSTKRFSFSLKDANFKNATVSVKKNGRVISVKKLPIKDHYGSATIAFDLSEMPSNEDRYDIVIKNVIDAKGAKRTFSYSTIMRAI